MQDIKTRTWHWKVEPGMEDAFDDLQGWLLSSQASAEIETTDTRARLSASYSPFQIRYRCPSQFCCCAQAA